MFLVQVAEVASEALGDAEREQRYIEVAHEDAIQELQASTKEITSSDVRAAQVSTSDSFID